MLQLALAIWGVIVLFTGKLKVSGNKVVEGTAARLLGLLLLAPLPVAFMIGIAVGIWAGANGRNLDDIHMPLMAVEVGLVIATAVLVFGIAHAIGKPPEQKQFPPPWNPTQYAPPNFPPPGPPADPNNPYHPPQF